MSNKHAVAISIISFLLSVLFIFYLSKDPYKLVNFISSLGLLGPLISLFLYGALAVTPIPTDPITIINGAIFGPVFGTIISWVGTNLASIIEYYIGKSISHITNFHKHKEKLPFGISKYPINSIWFLIFGRFVPGYGGKVVSILGGVYKVPLWRYIWTAAIANFVGSLLFAIGGWGLLTQIVSLIKNLNL